MPSLASAARNWSGVILLSCTTRAIVRSTSVSSTLMPDSLANCISARSLMRRSSTCLSSTSGAGSGTLEMLSWRIVLARLSLMSYCVIASSLTTATTRSSGTSGALGSALAAGAGRAEAGAVTGSCGLARGDCAAAPPADATTRAATKARSTTAMDFMDSLSPVGIATMRAIWMLEVGQRIETCVAPQERRVVGAQIPRHASAQQVERTGSDPREAVEFQLDEHRVGGLLGRRRQAMEHEAQDPAVLIVLDACDGLERLFIVQRVVPAAEQRHVVADRPLARDIELPQCIDATGGGIDELAGVAIAEVERAAEPRRVAQRDVELLVLADVEVLLDEALQRPGVGQLALGLEQDVGARARARHLGERHALVGEVEALAERHAQPLRTRQRVEQPRGHRHRQLVGVADAVVAEIAVLAEELREIEVVDRRVEDRQRVLVAVRDVDVEEPRLERLHEVFAEHAPVAL